jgi:hypothetical protein
MDSEEEEDGEKEEEEKEEGEEEEEHPSEVAEPISALLLVQFWEKSWKAWERRSKHDPRIQGLKERMQLLRTKKACGLSPDSQGKAIADDPYSCGEIDVKMVDRFAGVLNEQDYHRINSFLHWTEESAVRRGELKVDRSLEGKYIGNGRYTYEII